MPAARAFLLEARMDRDGVMYLHMIYVIGLEPMFVALNQVCDCLFWWETNEIHHHVLLICSVLTCLPRARYITVLIENIVSLNTPGRC